MKKMFPVLAALLLGCSSKPAGEQTENVRTDSANNEGQPTEMVSGEGTLNNNFVPHMTLEDRTVMVMLKGVDMKFTFPVGGQATEKREDGFGFSYPRQSNLHLRRYRFAAHSPPCDTKE